ncbi:MAG: zf-HC2 domain-containing protein [Gammaproteobacteria bacterium]
MEPRQSFPHTAHHDVWLLLPWYVNGTLEGRELDLVQQHLQVCITCRKELAVQQRLAETIRNSKIIALSPQIAFSRLRERIGSGAQSLKAQTRGWRSLHRRCSDGWARLSRGSLPRRAAIALSLPVLLIIGLVLSARLWLAPVNVEPKYHTLANPGSLPAPKENEIRVVFAETVNQEQIEQLVLAVDAQIVDGPSSVGAYTLRVGHNLSAAVERLRRDPRVLFAEPALPIARANPSADSRR